ncbi:MAG: hypothetical protein U0T56_11655 [Ferruginibacter sp.]
MEIGRVTAGTMIVDGEDWGDVNSWKDIYDQAITSLLGGQESEHALSPI